MSKRTITLTVLAALLLAMGVVTALSRHDPQQVPVSSPAKKYAFVNLGVRCAAAATDYQSKAQTLSTQAEQANTALQVEIAKTQTMNTANATSNTETLNKTRADYMSIYNAGGMTAEEYHVKVAQLDQAQATVGTPSSAIQSEINRIQTEAAKQYEESKQKVIDMQNSAMKLQSCADSATARRNFTPSDVAAFETLIAGSAQP
jgi:hypothetical protein